MDKNVKPHKHYHIYEWGSDIYLQTVCEHHIYDFIGTLSKKAYPFFTTDIDASCKICQLFTIPRIIKYIHSKETIL